MYKLLLAALFFANNTYGNSYASDAAEGGGGLSAFIILAAIVYVLAFTDFKNDKRRSYRDLVIAGLIIFLTFKFSIWIDIIGALAFIAWLIYSFLKRKK